MLTTVNRDITNHLSTFAIDRVNHTKISEVTFKLPHHHHQQQIHPFCMPWMTVVLQWFEHVQQKL
jgi:hypothetical protein